MAGNGSVFRLRRSFPNRDSIDDLTPGLSVFASMARAAHAPLRPQVVHQLFFQYSSRLNEQAAVDGLMGHSHAPVIRVLRLQPSGNLLGRPVQNQFTRSDVPQLAVPGKKTAFRTRRRVPGLVVHIMSTISRAATMARDFPTHRGGGPIDTSEISRVDQPEAIPREMSSLNERDWQPRAATSDGRDAATRQQHLANGGMWLAISAPDLMQRLTGFPTNPDVGSLTRRKARPFSLGHRHHP